jgi:hypothetical protein
MWRDDDRDKRNRHRVVDLRQPAAPDEQWLASSSVGQDTKAPPESSGGAFVS